MSGIAILALVALAFPTILKKWAAWQSRRQLAIDLANVRLIMGPRLVASEWEGDNTVMERAENLKGLLRLSGNTWIDENNIIVRVYHPHGSGGNTAIPFDTWRLMVQQEFAAICNKYAAEATARGPQITAAYFGQRQNMNAL